MWAMQAAAAGKARRAPGSGRGRGRRRGGRGGCGGKCAASAEPRGQGGQRRGVLVSLSLNFVARRGLRCGSWSRGVMVLWLSLLL